MASLTRHSKGWKVRYRVFYPDGTSRVAFVYRVHQQDARRLAAQAGQLEHLTQQNALRRQDAVPFQHYGLLKDADLAQWFPGQAVSAYDPGHLLDAYERHCRTRMTSPVAIHGNLLRAQHWIQQHDLSRITASALRIWQERRTQERARKTVNLEHDILRHLLDVCMQAGWREDNPARQLPKLSWKPSRLPLALTMDQVARALAETRALSQRARPSSVHGQLYRLVVAGVFFGLRRGELQHLLARDTDGQQVVVQGKTLPDGTEWTPKDREWRVIRYAGMGQPIGVVFGGVEDGYVWSPEAARQRPFFRDTLGAAVNRLLHRLGPGLTLHCLRHTFATWRLEQGDSLLQVQGMMGHSSLVTLTRYAHVQPTPLRNLLDLL